MAGARVGPLKVVSFTYEIRDQDGVLQERPDVPVTYLHGGRGDIFDQVAAALEGRAVGDYVEVTLAPEEAFGHREPGLLFSDDLENAPPDVRRLGAEVEMTSERGEKKTFVVSRIADGRITLDGNHPLAGKTLTFQVTVTGIRDASGDEVMRGAPAEAGPALH